MLSYLMAAMINLSAGPWEIVNDGVMGGRSTARVDVTDDGIRFAGNLSLENNGGFSSTRHLLSDAPVGMNGVRLQVRGDGRAYQLRLRQDQRFDGVAWSAPFQTGDGWETIEFSFAEFKPVFRGRPVPQAGPVDPAAVTQIGIMLSDKQPGPFALEIRQINFFRTDE